MRILLPWPVLALCALRAQLWAHHARHLLDDYWAYEIVIRAKAEMQETFTASHGLLPESTELSPRMRRKC